MGQGVSERALKPPVEIRKAAAPDLEAIRDIYNEAILTTTATFDTEPKTLEERQQWFSGHDERHPVLVAVLEGRVVGWASINPWSDRRAYDHKAGTSFYLESKVSGPGHRRKH